MAELFVRDDDGSLDSDRLWVTVVNRAPLVLHPGDQTVNEDEQVLIETTAVDAVSDMPGVRYRIEFGDGNATGWMQDASRTYVYRDSGVWTVRVHARDGDGDTGYVEFNVTVTNVEPTCMMELEVAELDEDEEFSVYGEAMDTYSDLETLRWRFDFGDGRVTDWRYRPIQRTTHSYPAAGTYTVSLEVLDDDGATSMESGTVDVVNLVPLVELEGPRSSVDEDEEVLLTAKGTDTPSDSAGLEFRWDLGDGTVMDWSDQVEVEHGYSAAGTYVVEVRVRDDDGAVAFGQVPVKVVNRPPIAEGIQSATRVVEGEAVTFDATGTRDTVSDMEDLTVEWSRGSDVQIGMKVTFTFEDEGSFTVILRVTDDDGAVSELFFSVNVRNLAPTGVATVDRTEAEVAKIFNFAALDLQDTPNDVEGLTVTWSFGDGSLGTGVTTTHRYDEPGDYTVTMTVRDDDGATYDGFLYITVTEEGGMMSGRTATLAIAAAVAAIVIALITLMFLRRIGTTEDEEVDDEGESDPTVSEERVEEKVSPEDPVEDEGVG